MQNSGGCIGFRLITFHVITRGEGVSQWLDIRGMGRWGLCSFITLSYFSPNSTDWHRFVREKCFDIAKCRTVFSLYNHYYMDQAIMMNMTFSISQTKRYSRRVLVMYILASYMYFIYYIMISIYITTCLIDCIIYTSSPNMFFAVFR